MKKVEFDFSRLLGRIKVFGYIQEDLATFIGIAPGTLNAKLNNKANFTAPEIEGICKMLCIPKGEIGIYFFYTKSSEKLNQRRTR